MLFNNRYEAILQVVARILPFLLMMLPLSLCLSLSSSAAAAAVSLLLALPFHQHRRCHYHCYCHFHVYDPSCSAVMLQSMSSLSVMMRGLSMCSCLQIKSLICLTLRSEAMIPHQSAFQALLLVLLRQLFSLTNVGGLQRQLMAASIACLGALHTPGSELQKTKVSPVLR